MAIVVEEPLPGLITSAMRVNSVEKNLDTTAFVSSWVVAVELENEFGVSTLTLGGCFQVPRLRYRHTRKGCLSFLRCFLFKVLRMWRKRKSGLVL